jgi:uncharacterized protein (DUF433 family)
MAATDTTGTTTAPAAPAAAGPIDIGTLITRRPGVNGGRPIIAGTGTSVRRIAVLSTWEGRTPEHIVDSYPHLTLAQVHAALAYYHANRAEVDADLAADEALFDRLEREHPHGMPGPPPAQL